MAARPVVVGVDGSDESLQAAEWAAMEARRRGSGLRIVSAISPRMPAYHVSEQTAAISLHGLAARALASAVTRTAEVAPGLLTETILLSGPPALAVVAAGNDGAMLVIGAHGAGPLAAMILGSVSRYAATRAVCPVVVVREETRAVHRAVVAGVRDPQEAGETLEFAFTEAALRDADLVVVHAWYWFPPAVRVPAGIGSAMAGAGVLRGGVAGNGAAVEVVDPVQVSAEAEHNLAEAMRGWRDRYPSVRVREDVVHGHPDRVLADYSARADLLVIGRNDRRGIVGSGVGSIQRAVLNHARGPVAVIPSR
jgi:nucleotide-binding universal stress UspA family protein